MKRLLNSRIVSTVAFAAALSSGLAAGKLDLSSPKYGLYIHFGTPTFANPDEHSQIPAERFAPTGLDVKQWARTAKDAGVAFAVLTAKHESGFCLWKSADCDYCIAKSPVNADIIADFIAACETEGIAPGIHYSISDAYNEGAARGAKEPVPPLYFAVIKKHITELHTKYPRIRVQILDRSQRLSDAQWKELADIVHRLNPDCVLLDWVRSPIYGTQTVNKGWMWSPNETRNTADFLFGVYTRRMESGASWLANVGVNRAGKIPAEDITVLQQLKALIERGPTTAQTKAPPEKSDPSTRLKKLKELYDQGLISKDDYDRKVKEIMDSL